MRFKQFLPILEWGASYKKSHIKDDLTAGLTVGVMLIPQGMAYAMIAGLPPIYGLYASTIPLILYAILGTSRQLAVGPVAMVSLLTAAGIGSIAEGGTQLYIELAIALALFVGLIQFLLGAFRLGFLVNFLSHPVISGFTSAAAIIIGLSQLGNFLGISIPREYMVHEKVIAAFQQFADINWATFALGIAGVVVIKGAKRIHPGLPGPLLAVVVGILAVWGMGLTGQGVKIVGSVPEGLPSIGMPGVNMENLQSLLPIALAIALVSFMESIAVAKAIQAKHRNYKVDANQELVALGIANIGGSFFQSYPVTGGFSRTAVNDQAGAKTGLAAIISAVLIVLTLLFLTPLFYYLPKSILAAVIMVAVFGLVDIKEVVHLWKSDRTDLVMLLVTFFATLLLGIEEGIGIGVILSLAMVIYRTTKPHIAVLGNVTGTHFYRNVERFDDAKERPELLLVRFDAQLYFANTNFFKEKLEELAAERGDQLKAIIINAESINRLDSSGAHAISEVVDLFRSRGIQLFFAGIKGPVRDAMVRSHLMDKVGKENVFMDIQHAVEYFDNTQQNDGQPSHQEYTLQANV
jgi:SulP family sulfate permease